MADSAVFPGAGPSTTLNPDSFGTRSAETSLRSLLETHVSRLAVLDYVEGFYQGDTIRLVRSVWPEVRKYGYWKAKADGPYAGEAMPYREFMAYANGVKSGRNCTPADAIKDIVIYDVQDQTASAKLTAWWGTDYLLLAREQGKWMIVQVLWPSPPPK